MGNQESSLGCQNRSGMKNDQETYVNGKVNNLYIYWK